MSDPQLPAEMLNHVVDHLRDTKNALGNCCLISKSWIPRTRKHLFADIEFQTEIHLGSWKKTFPDPSNSPACYTKTLSVGCPQVVTSADAEVGGWIRGFSSVVHLVVRSQTPFAHRSFSLVPFHGLSSVLKSLRMVVPALPSSRIINLTLSFPLLEDLTVFTPYDPRADNDDNPDMLLPIIQPSSPPMLTGSLELLLMDGGMEPLTRRLLSLPGGIHFRKLALT